MQNNISRKESTIQDNKCLLKKKYPVKETLLYCATDQFSPSIYYIVKNVLILTNFFRYGRKFTMVFCAAISAALCIIQSFSTSYLMFMILELLSSTVSSGIYTVTFILGIWSSNFKTVNW